METINNRQYIDFSNAHTIIESLYQTRKKDCDFATFVGIREALIERKTDVIYCLTRLTVKEIGKYIYVRPDRKKIQIVEDLWDGLLGMFNILSTGYSFYISTTPEEDERQYIKQLRQITEDNFIAWKEDRAAKAEAKKKALENPETLEEFNIFIDKKGENALSSQQRAIYDELMTGRIKEKKELENSRNAHITSVVVGESDFLIIENFHAKKQIPIWVVRLSDRVDRPIFEELRDRAKSLGGYYSSYKGHGAIPGFVFERKEAAELFTQIKDGDVNASALRAAINADKTLNRAERVQEKAQRIEENATEELERDRKDNTTRRARIASSIQQRAIAEIEFSKTMYEIGERTKQGTIKHLGRLSDIVQLEELYSILSRCKWDYIKEKGIREQDFVYSVEVIDFAKFPYPRIYKDPNVYNVLSRAGQDNGKKLATARMIKRLNSVKGEYLTVKDGKSMEDFNRIFCWSSPSLDRWDVMNYKHQYMRYTRMQKLGITTIYELRAALRELLDIDQKAEISPEFRKLQTVRELERKFVNLSIPGFFPTPSQLAIEVIEKAKIEDHHTVLEPSAGLGHLAEAIASAHPDNDLICIENYHPLVEALQIKELNALHMDFLQLENKTFDRIVMNPPFENLADIDHVLHAWKLLNPGGRIVAIMAANKSGERQKIKDFMTFVDKYGAMESNEDGAFKSSFRPTGVRTVTVILDKPFKIEQQQGPLVQGALNFGERAA